MRVKTLLLASLALSGIAPGRAGVQTAPARRTDRPKLVVGIVVDQMRYDFLYRYYHYYGEGGLKRLLKKGYSFSSAYYPYAPTVTGPGHASIYTGTTPAYHGIAGNNWLDRTTGTRSYCTDDPDVRAVGGDSAAGRMSPRNLQATTLGDQLKLASNLRSKTIAVSLKDRASILPGGRSADGAYWYDGRTGNFMSSTWYGAQLPAWLQAFNAQNRSEYYLSQTWSPIGKPEWYDQACTADDMPYEGELAKGAGHTFPYALKAIAGKAGVDFDLIRRTGFGIHLTTEVALAALNGTDIAADDETDLLAISYSSTDYVGHIFGPNSREAMDAYLRLDADIARLLDALDRKVGKDEYLLFLSADHGITEVPEYLQANRMPAGRYDTRQLTRALNDTLSSRHGPGSYVKHIAEEQVYLDHRLIAQKRLSLRSVEQQVAEILRDQPMVADAIASDDLPFAGSGTHFLQRLYLGHHSQRSGDVHFITRPGVIESFGNTGTTHSSVYEYDTHVPMIFYGWQIAPGSGAQVVHITDIVPTVCSLLNIMAPSASIGRSRLQLRKKGALVVD